MASVVFWVGLLRSRHGHPKFGSSVTHLKLRHRRLQARPQRLGGSQRQVQPSGESPHEASTLNCASPLHFLLRCQEMTIALPESQLSLPLICLKHRGHLSMESLGKQTGCRGMHPPAHAVHVASIDLARTRCQSCTRNSNIS